MYINIETAIYVDIHIKKNRTGTNRKGNFHLFAATENGNSNGQLLFQQTCSFFIKVLVT
jgi:hypothetical protein